MKKWLILLMAFAIALAPVGFGADEVEAKKGGYKSGKKSYNNNTTPNNKSDSTLNSSKNTGKSNTGTAATNRSGGFMSGLMFGGLAGLLFGSMFDGLGALGAILGFMVNMLAIVALIGIVLAAFTYIKNSRRNQDSNQWKKS